MPRKRLRDLGIIIGTLPPGPFNAITDVAGVRVGHTTLFSGEGPLRPGHGPVRTGVSVVLAHGGNIFQEKVRVAVHTINGFGKVFGFEQVRELGVLEAPIALTNTLNVGLVVDALVQYSIQHNPDIGIRTSTANVIVGETHDGYLNDIQGRHVKAQHVWAAIEGARRGEVVEGAVGAGTGTSCYGWKGGIGTASRCLAPDMGAYTLGALVQSNFGEDKDLVIAGVPVGQRLLPPGKPPDKPPDGGSIMIVLATDAPLSSRQLGRLCVRATASLARTGSYLSHGSGDFVIAFSTAQYLPHIPDNITASHTTLIDDGKVINALFRAVVESVEEAVINSLCCAETVKGRDGHTSYALPLEEVVKIVKSNI